MPPWSRHFDRAYCFHFVKDAARLPGITEEFRRVGLLDDLLGTRLVGLPVLPAATPSHQKSQEESQDKWRKEYDKCFLLLIHA